MGQMTKMAIGPVQAVCGAHVLHWGLWDSGTLRRWLLEFVLPALMLAAMSALTVTLLVLVVGAVAEMGSYAPSDEANPDLWSKACFGPPFLWDRQAYPGYSSPMEMLDGHGPASAEPWPGQQPNDQIDTPWARWLPE